MTADLPLTGLRVLDFTHAAAGPFSTMFLSDLGAEVIKIEKPGRGDGARYMGEPLLGPLDSDYYIGLNRGKRSVGIDLATPAGAAVARELAAKSDFVVQNFRPGVMDRLSLGFDDLRHVRSQLIYCSISAFGDSGPWRDRPANDIIMQSITGLMAMTGEPDGPPTRIGSPICDFASGLFALSGMLAALHTREAHPEGQHIRISMLESAFAFMANYIPAVVDLGRVIPRLGRGHAQIVPYQAFECADGEYLMVGAFTNRFWRNLCHAIGYPDWADDPRYAANSLRLTNRATLVPLLEDVFRTRPREDWSTVLAEADVPASPVLSLREALELPPSIAANAVQAIQADDGTVVHVVGMPIHSTGWTPGPASLPPSLGSDTSEVLQSLLGLSPESIDDLAATGSIEK